MRVVLLIYSALSFSYILFVCERVSVGERRRKREGGDRERVSHCVHVEA